MDRVHQVVLIGSVFLGSWLGMRALNEVGHVLGAILSGVQVRQVVLNTFLISRTDLAENLAPLVVLWAGPLCGVLIPIAAWLLWASLRMPGAFVLQFFAGFCLIANGSYLAFGSFAEIGDCGEMIRHGSSPWQLWIFAAATVPTGFWLWNGLDKNFGMGVSGGRVNPAIAYATLMVAIFLLGIGFLVGGE